LKVKDAIRIFILIIFIGSGKLHAQPVYLLHRTYAQQFYILDSIFTVISNYDSVRVAAEIKKLAKWAGDNGDQQLRYSVNLMLFRYSERKGKYNPWLEKELPKFIQELSDNKMQFIKAEAMALMADHYWIDYNKSEAGFENAFNAYKIYSKVNAVDFPAKSFYLYSLGINYMRFREYKGALQFLQEAGNTVPFYKEIQLFNVQNAIGLCYRNIGIYDSAIYYFKAAYKDAEIKNSVIWMGITSGNIGITYYLQEQYKEAIPLLEKDIRTCIEGNVKSNAAKSLAILGDIYLIQNDKKRALQLLLQSYQIIIDKKRYWDYDLLQDIYPRLAKAYAANGDLEMAYKFMDSTTIVTDSIVNQKNMLRLSRVVQKQEREKFELEAQKLDDEKKMQSLTRNSLLGGIFSLAAIALLFINRQRLKYRIIQGKMQTEKMQADKELNNARLQLTNFTRNIQEKNELIEKFSAEIERLQALPCSVELPDTQANLQKLQQSTILTEEQWEDFRTVFEKVHNGFFLRLREKLPDLSPAEVRFIALSKLNFNNKEMAGILGISTDAIRMSRHRLRKKLNLPEDENLDKLVEKI